MHRRRIIAAICGFAVLLSLGFLAGTSPAQNDSKAGAAAAAPKPEVSEGEYNPADDRFIVHEWGTFTSFTGSDGVKLEFRPLVDNDLPPFVIDRATQVGVVPFSVMLSKQGYLTMQRMETPVTYFYTNRERQVRAKVRFPEGLLTEFYPPVASIGPELTEAEKQIVQKQLGNQTPEQVALVTKALSDRRNIRNSELDWGTITLIPEQSLAPALSDKQAARGVLERMKLKLLPRSKKHFDYYYARETDAAYVHVNQPIDPNNRWKPVGDFFEKFLFYRGIGNFDLPISMHGRGGGRFLVTNHGSEPILSPILFSLSKEKRQFVAGDVIPPGETIVLQLPEASSDHRELLKLVQSALVEAGLYGKEASAMVNTWHQSWFQEKGTRLFYLLPQKQTDAMLPLEVSPAPDQTVRVMVGRLEVMTPELEQRLKALLKRDDVPSATSDPTADEPRETKEEAATDELTTALNSLGRFAEPALTRIVQISDDPVVTERAETLIERIQVGRLKQK